MRIIKIIRRIPLFDGIISIVEKRYCDYTYKARELKAMPRQVESRGDDYPDITFFIIRRNNSNVGLFSYVIGALGGIVYAVDQGYIPIIDMQNYSNPYLDEKKGGNAWEYFFEQPCGYSLKDIEHAKNVILSEGIPTWNCPDMRVFEEANDEYAFWKQMWNEYVRINKLTFEHIYYISKGMDYKNSCGVIIRGTDYTKNKPIGHPVQPTPDQAIKTVDELLKKWGYNNFFLTTEDQKMYTLFRKFTDFNLMSLNSYRLDKDDITNYNIPEKISNTIGGYKHGLDYLTNVWIVSQCESIIAGKCGASIAAKMMSNEYRKEYYWELGIYK